MRFQIPALAAMLPAALAGINCRGSALCPLASFLRSGSCHRTGARVTLIGGPGKMGIAQGLRDAMYSSPMPDDVIYNSGDHVICVSSSLPITIKGDISATDGVVTGDVSLSLSGMLGNGGVCVFVENTKEPLYLGQIKPLVDKILEHGCNTCGNVPTHFISESSNDDKFGVVKIDYVRSPNCVGNCISKVDETNHGVKRSVKGPEIRHISLPWTA